MTASRGPEPAFLAAHDGIQIAYEGSGSAGPLAVFVHATGFCKEVCDPVVADTRSLGADFRVVAFDQRAHGDSGTPAPPFDWWDSGRDVLSIVDASAEGNACVVGVGHSSGGAALALAELLRPGTFAALVLVEPIIPPPPYQPYPEHPIVAGARRRKARFSSRRAAFENYVSKSAFAGWEDRVLWAYVNGGFREEEDGVVLKCTPESEAEFFIAAGTHGAWDRLGEIAAPTLLLAGEHSTTHREPLLAQLADRFGNARHVVIPDSSHFLWMERPGVVAEHIATAIRDST